MSDQLYRVAARSKLTGWSGAGRPMSKELAEAYVAQGNSLHPEIAHWVEAAEPESGLRLELSRALRFRPSPSTGS